MRLVFDIETNGLLDQLNTIHSLCMVDVDTGEQWSCHDDPEWEHPLGIPNIGIDGGLDLLMKADKVIGHNIIKFDIPAIQKVKPWFCLSREQVIDTLIDSRLIYPEVKDNDFKKRRKKMQKFEEWYRRTSQNLYQETGTAAAFAQSWAQEFIKEYWPGYLIGSHGLEAWGIRLGEWKGDYSKMMKAKGLDPWAEWNPDMQTYCDQDITVNLKLFRVFEKKNYAARARIIERDFAWILAEMEMNGFPFDMEKALKLQATLMKRRAEIMDQIKDAFPPIEERWTFIPKVNNSKLGYVKGKPFEKSQTIHFNPGSRDHIARWLKRKYGWEPKSFTETGKPVVDESVLSKLKFPEAKLLAECFMIDKRLGMLEGKGGKGLIPFAKKSHDGRIHGSVITNGAITRRCTHNSPNMGQIPALTVPFGKEFRELMCAIPGFSLLGWDASGLELRCFAHYMARYDGGKYIQTVLEGDIHWVHANALSGGKFDGVEYDEHNEEHAYWRNKIAKVFIYAFLYGAGAEKIGSIVVPKGSEAEKKRAGQKLINTFLKRTPALKRLKEDIQARLADGKATIRGIDGGELKVRSSHSALNTLLQSAGAIAVKVATIIFYDKLIAMGLENGKDFMMSAHVHDEVQILVRKGLEERVGNAAIEAMREAGEALGFKCPLDGEYKFGQSWADTH